MAGPAAAGVYGTTSTGVRSFAAGYPEAQDLFLSRRLTIDPENGAFLLNEAGNPVPPEVESGLLLRWDEIEYLDFQETP